MRPPAEEGFTLIEILVALAVLGLSAVALLNLAGENTRTAAAMETRTLAAVVAENRAIEALVAPATPAFGRTSGADPLAGREWRWLRLVSRTADPRILRIDVVVQAPDARRTAAEVTVFRGAP
ncbi:MAG: type II secretion system minor pseudopilin GspI [Phenylobacterium sp.]|jgi:general secretion pathway protein I|uniref:type II secretion system minor pseudopilin GspI n=1 Tax=Phenylobacterium sp. TaxID=1871053 RepID=UPI002A35FCB2|nr:type II secretion system minor pseudopilin GspI [Phenylobacterium sp.]MDX9998102.1 type II secretion system minor pseudopilin GspI [Phenylobacterium sp.]